jgi:cell division protein ZipA
MLRGLASAALLIAAGVVILLWWRARRPAVHAADEEIHFARAEESRARGDAVLPHGPSEDAGHVLGSLDVPRETGYDPDGDFLPNETVEWVVHVTFAGDPALRSAAVMERVERELKKHYTGLTIHGFDPAQKRWTYVVPSEPIAVTRLQLSWRYEPIDEDDPLATLGDFRDRLRGVTAAVSPLGDASVTAPVKPEDAVKRAQHLRDLHQRLDRPAGLLLAAPDGQPFDGRKVWDVLASLGLEWGDMDYFHWKNEGGVGDDAFFSVSTSTSPGYFLPEEVIAGRVQVEDLIFHFSIPRTHAPVAVFDALGRAAAYAQKRLGGTLHDEGGEPAKLEAARAEVDRVARELAAAGFVPGSEAALRLF